jgi:hypothetical protein
VPRSDPRRCRENVNSASVMVANNSNLVVVSGPVALNSVSLGLNLNNAILSVNYVSYE